MTYVHLRIDSETVLDGELDRGQRPSQPEIVQLIQRQQRSNQPGIMAVLVELRAAIEKNQPVTINLRTRSDGYNLTVEYRTEPVLGGFAENQAQEVGASHRPAKQ